MITAKLTFAVGMGAENLLRFINKERPKVKITCERFLPDQDKTPIRRREIKKCLKTVWPIIR
jgi:hypothetical protein